MKRYYFKKIINLFILFLFILFLFNFIVLSFNYINNYSELVEHFNDLIASDSAIGSATNFAYTSFFGGVANNFSIYGSLVFGNLFYYILVFGIPFLILWLVLRVMLLLSTWGGKINV